MRVLVMFTLTAALTACGSRANVQCEENANCDLSTGGVCTAGGGDQWCAYPDASCASGYRYSTQSIGGGLSGECTDPAAIDAGTDASFDASFDATVDAPGIPFIDVAYPSEWNFSITGPVSGYFLVINRSNHPLDMTTLHVESVTDDNATAFIQVKSKTLTTTIPQASAGGALSGESTMLLVDSGLVTEPRSNTSDDWLNIEVDSAPAGNYDIHATVVAVVENHPIQMLMTIHHLQSQTIYADPVVAKRVTIFQ